MGKRGKHKKQPWSIKKKMIVYSILGVLVLIIALPYLLHRNGELPAGVHTRGAATPFSPEDVQLLIDTTAFDTQTNKRVIKQDIFDAALKMIEEAQTFVYVDFFLWNGWQGSVPENHRALSTELAQALIQKKTKQPGIQILALTDPINRIYGHHQPSFFEEMAQAGIPVVFTDLDQLHESNMLFSAPAETYGRLLMKIKGIRKHLDNPTTANPFDKGGAPISRKQMATLLKFKANHRKILIADDGNGKHCALVTSFNPADGSSAHSNIGLLIKGNAVGDAMKSELDCVEWSATPNSFVMENAPDDWRQVASNIRAAMPMQTGGIPLSPNQAFLEWNSEEAIRDRLLSILSNAGPGDEVRITMFYLSDRDVVRGIKEASEGGATVQLILDSNRDAFGREKMGIPNRPVAAELMKFASSDEARLQLRWADTHGEQFHTKAITVTNKERNKHELLCGSANWTRRNIQDLNMEANVYVANAPDVVNEFNTYFDRAWGNTDGLSHTLDYEAFAEKGLKLFGKTMLYRFQETTGLSTF